MHIFANRCPVLAEFALNKILDIWRNLQLTALPHTTALLALNAVGIEAAFAALARLSAPWPLVWAILAAVLAGNLLLVSSAVRRVRSLPGAMLFWLVLTLAATAVEQVLAYRHSVKMPAPFSPEHAAHLAPVAACHAAFYAAALGAVFVVFRRRRAGGLSAAGGPDSSLPLPR